MRTVVFDSSCLIDMHKGKLLISMLNLPYDFQIPEIIFKDELLSIASAEKKSLKKHGLQTVNLSGESVSRANKYFRQNPRLSLKDCFALVLAEQISDCILLTGDANLRRVASDIRIEVHGVLWGIDEMRNHKIVNPSVLYRALSIFKNDEMVFLPEREIEMRLRSLKREL